jgi:predicted GIY-YIG superfamily endonuclease
MVFIYILQLENKKYYVGKTLNPGFRLEQHFNSSGSQWTKKYKPLKVLEIIPNCDNFDEDKYTLKFMEKYGINNVRGGTFCELKLNKDNKTIIKKMLKGAMDKCYICSL